VLSRQQYLKAMGIDVWSIRQAPGDLAVVQPILPQGEPDRAAPATYRSISNASVKNAAVKRAVTDAIIPADRQTEQEVPEFRLALLHYGSIGLCLSLGKTAELPRRFCDDIAGIMGGELKEARYHQLQWPMLSSRNFDQSIAAAREVVTQKFRVLPQRVVVFGEDVGEYFNPLRDLPVLTPGAIGSQSFLLIPSLGDLMGSSAAKRELMAILYQWRLA
jgi:hypothetical protein